MTMRSADGGKTWSNPRHVVQLVDGTRDLPIDPSDGAQTLTGLKVPFTGAGNIALDRSTGTYYIVFSDNRAGKHDVADPRSNTGIYMVTSHDGKNWGRPVTVSNAWSDQWEPFAAVNPVTHRLGVVFLDRHYGHQRRFYNLTYAKQRWNGSFNRIRISTAGSHPKRSAWFRSVDDPTAQGEPHCVP